MDIDVQRTIKEIEENIKKLSEETCHKYHTSLSYDSHVQFAGSLCDVSNYEDYHSAYRDFYESLELVITVKIRKGK